MFRPKRFLEKSASYGSSGRSAWGKMLVHWSSNFHRFFKNLVFTTKKRPFTSSFWSRPQVFVKKDFFIWSLLWFISWRIYSLLWRVRHNSKIWPKNDLLNTKHWKIQCFFNMLEIILKKHNKFRLLIYRLGVSRRKFEGANAQTPRLRRKATEHRSSYIRCFSVFGPGGSGISLLWLPLCSQPLFRKPTKHGLWEKLFGFSR